MEKKHSGLGVASFVISLIAGVLMFLVFVVAGVMDTSTPGGMDEESLGAMLVGLSLFGLLFVELIAIGLGFAALFQQNRQKVFAVLGMVIAVATIAVTVLLLAIGLML